MVTKKTVIGITDCSKYQNYARWILSEPNTEVVRLGYTFANLDAIKTCDGVLLTGGEDVHPRFYGQPELLPFCYVDDMDERRDEFEWEVLAWSQKNKLPVLGICRGLQMTNVFLGGTLIPDIPRTGKPDHAKVDQVDRYHSVTIMGETQLADTAGIKDGVVNSAHHQSANRLGAGLRISALSTDGIVEALEWEKPDDKPFLMLVQWHPERMNDMSSPLSEKIRKKFIQTCQQH